MLNWRLRIACVVGARPNFIKMAALIDEMRRRPSITPYLIHTGQHFSAGMSDAFFRDLSMPQPDVNLGVGGGTQTEQTAEIMRRLEPVFRSTGPSVVLVVGDVNSTVAAALVAAKLGISIAHVEAGLRSFDRTMPEEINRVVTDVLSDYLFVTEPSGRKNLLAEGIREGRIYFVGNVMIDTLLRFRSRADESDVLNRLGLSRRQYVVVTLHRPSNVDNPAQLVRLTNVLSELATRIQVVFPVHPRTMARMESAAIAPAGVLLVPPLGYIDFLRLIGDARLVLTDSGGIQEETTLLQVSCLTLRENTERPVTVEQGTNRLIGTDPDTIVSAVQHVLDSREEIVAPVPELWDGKASARILDILEANVHPSLG
jgi:UDP-N-acetylglucosamine 2-epimerase (non-hydrolysing)